MDARRLARSRGRALRNATRDRMRSTSPMARSGSRSDSKRRASTSNAIDWYRRRSSIWSVSGRLSQRRKVREPMGVTVESSIANNVAESWPDNDTSISRLRRVAASRCSASPRSSTESVVMWGSAVF
jgi:hypothetical protein